MPRKKTKRTARPIVIGHLENMNKDIFIDYQEEITEMIKGNHGVYALYQQDKLYYIGLATDLKNRLNTHLSDRHQKNWDSFNLYIIRKADYLRELEALLLRIADPKGNRQRGKLKDSNNRMPELKRKALQKNKDKIDKYFARKKTGKKKIAKKSVVLDKPLTARPGTKRAKVFQKWQEQNTIICPTREDGFQETFMKNHCWYAIRIDARRIPCIKYIALYRKHPTSAITHYARVDSIKPYKNTGKYIVHLKTKPRKIGPVKYTKCKKDVQYSMRSPAFTSFDKLKKAKTLNACL